MIVIGLAVNASAVGSADAEAADQPQRASISGRILGTNGKALRNVKVILYVPAYGGNEEVFVTTTTDADGRYSFTGLRRWGYNVLAFSQGLAIDGRAVNIEEGEQLALQDIRLEPPLPAALEVRDPQGKPLAGVKLRTLKWSGPTGLAPRLTAFDLCRLGVPVSASGTDGRLQLLPLPRGARVSGIVAHRDFAPAAFETELDPRAHLPSITLKKGGFIRIQLGLKNNVSRLPWVQVSTSLRAYGLAMPSRTSYAFENIAIEGKDELVLPVEPGLLTCLRLDHPRFTIVPQMSDWDPSESYGIEVGKTQDFKMTVHPKVVFSARLLNRETGKPFAGDVVIWGYVADRGRVAIDERFGAGWAFAGSTRADENGDFELPLAAGRVKLRLQPRTSIVEPETVELGVRANDQKQIISVGARPIPPIAGTVVDAEGRPVRSAIVRVQKQFRGISPIVTDGSGRFRFQLPWLPMKMGSDADSTVTVVAFDPLRPLSGRLSLKFDRRTLAADLQDLRITLATQPLDAAIDMVSIDDPIGTPSESQRSLVGQPAPELDCQAWLNDNGKSHTLADFRGKYVLLDFWTTGCGPCHADFPSIKLLRDLYRDRDFVVIGVHDNSADLQSIRVHVAKQKLDFLIAVDHPDGRTLRDYARFVSFGHPTSFGYPTYVLIDPKGIVLKTSRDQGEPRLRVQMFEIVRRHVLKLVRR